MRGTEQQHICANEIALDAAEPELLASAVGTQTGGSKLVLSGMIPGWATARFPGRLIVLGSYFEIS